MRRLAATAIVCAAAVFVGCSTSTSAPKPSQGNTAAGPLPCSTVFARGSTLTEDEYRAGACTDGTHFEALVAQRCVDGRSLVRLGQSWAFIGDTVHTATGALVDDPIYGADYGACTGLR